jgi:hypothetical protein
LLARFKIGNREFVVIASAFGFACHVGGIRLR